VRWLLFTLGPLPQAIRLASFGGVLWTKMVGFGFLSSWLSVEFLVLIAAKTAPRPTATGRGRPHTTFDGIDDVCYAFGWILSSLFLVCFPIGAFSFHFMPESWGDPLLVDILVIFTPLMVTTTSYYLLSALWLLGLLNWVCHRNVDLAQTLLVAFPVKGTDIIEVDENAVLALDGFVFHFLICLCSYKFLYNSYGTTNPGWTAVFG